jgi:hypothetical protein
MIDEFVNCLTSRDANSPNRHSNSHNVDLSGVPASNQAREVPLIFPYVERLVNILRVENRLHVEYNCCEDNDC